MTLFFTDKKPYVLTTIVFQKVNQSLNFIPFVKIKVSSCALYPGSAPEGPAYGVFPFEMKIRLGQVKITIRTDDLFVFPQTVPTAGADLRINEAYEIFDQEILNIFS